MRFSTLQDWLSWIESCHPNEIELGLERVDRVAGDLELDFSAVQVITVAGTNGKGSCLAVLQHLLIQAGFSVGCFTSPHFIRYNERITLNGVEVDDAPLIESFARIDAVSHDTALTYFEYATLAALDIFSRAKLDVVLLEVGLGGRLDAVNIIDSDIAIVTSIALDHEDWLGTDLNGIGEEKAGIFRAEKPALCGDPNPPESIKAVAEKCGALLYRRGIEFDITTTSLSEAVWVGQTAQHQPCTLTDLSLPSLPVDSVTVALQALALLPWDIPLTVYQHLPAISLTGRFERRYSEGREIILDVAHNPAAAKHLAKQLLARPITGRTYGLLAMMSDKDTEGVIAALASSFDAWFLADLNKVARAQSAKYLADQVAKQGINMISVSKNIRQAYRRVRSLMGPEDRLVVLGSFFTVSEVLTILARDERRKEQTDE